MSSTTTKQQQQQPEETQYFSFCKVPQILHQNWSEIDPSKRTQVGYIEFVELPNGTKEEYFVLVDESTQEEMRVPLKQPKTPHQPYLLFTPQQPSEAERQQQQQQQLGNNGVSEVKFQYNTQLSKFREIALPFQFHQQLIAHQQRINEEQRDERTMYVATDLQQHIDDQTEVNLDAYRVQYELQQNEKTHQRRHRDSEQDVLRSIHTLLSSQQLASFDEIVAYTNQPKQYLLGIVKEYMQQITSGEHRGKYRMKK